MAQIAKISAICLTIVFIVPACFPANTIQTEVPSAPQNAEFEITRAVTTPEPKYSPQVQTPTSVNTLSAGLDPQHSDAGVSFNSDLLSLQIDFLELYAQSRPGVVSVTSSELDGLSVSSGFFIDDVGHVVTSYHGVKTESDLAVTTLSGDMFPARMVGKDPDSDIAVLKVEIPAGNFVPLPLGVSDDLQVGQIVAAIGNPFGLQGSMTTGIVSGLGQGLRYFRETLGGHALFPGEIIMTDTTMNQGNSGGPLLNLNGEVVGINSTVITSGDDRLTTGVAFSLPIDIARPIINALIQNGIFKYPYLGFSSIDELNFQEKKTLGILEVNGIYITEIEPGGPAEKAGLRAGSMDSEVPNLSLGGDLITGIDGQSVNRYDQLYAYLIKHKQPGDEITLTVVRGNRHEDIKLQLGNRPKPEYEDL